MKEARGGKREGAGRPKKGGREFSDKFRANVLRALKRKAAELGMADPFEAVADLALNPAHQSSVRAAAWKLIAEMNVVKESKQSLDVNHFDRPQVYLPEPMAKPLEAQDKEKEIAAAVH